MSPEDSASRGVVQSGSSGGGFVLALYRTVDPSSTMTSSPTTKPNGPTRRLPIRSFGSGGGPSSSPPADDGPRRTASSYGSSPRFFGGGPSRRSSGSAVGVRRRRSRRVRVAGALALGGTGRAGRGLRAARRRTRRAVDLVAVRELHVVGRRRLRRRRLDRLRPLLRDVGGDRWFGSTAGHR